MLMKKFSELSLFSHLSKDFEQNKISLFLLYQTLSNLSDKDLSNLNITKKFGSFYWKHLEIDIAYIKFYNYNIQYGFLNIFRNSSSTYYIKVIDKHNCNEKFSDISQEDKKEFVKYCNFLVEKINNYIINKKTIFDELVELCSKLNGKNK